MKTKQVVNSIQTISDFKESLFESSGLYICPNCKAPVDIGRNKQVHPSPHSIQIAYDCYECGCSWILDYSFRNIIIPSDKIRYSITPDDMKTCDPLGASFKRQFKKLKKRITDIHTGWNSIHWTILSKNGRVHDKNYLANIPDTTKAYLKHYKGETEIFNDFLYAIEI